jgi:hypothetical protein
MLPLWRTACHPPCVSFTQVGDLTEGAKGVANFGSKAMSNAMNVVGHGLVGGLSSAAQVRTRERPCVGLPQMRVVPIEYAAPTPARTRTQRTDAPVRACTHVRVPLPRRCPADFRVVADVCTFLLPQPRLFHCVAQGGSFWKGACSGAVADAFGMEGGKFGKTGVCACVRVCVRVPMRVRVRARACACVRAREREPVLLRASRLRPPLIAS